MNSQNKTIANGNVKLKVVSLNVRGLRNRKKRRSLLYFFKKEKFDIVCLQETYLTKNDLHLIDREWGSTYHFSDGTHNSKGLLTLFNSNLKFNDLSLVMKNERVIVSKIVIDENVLTFVNVYAPCIQSEKSHFLDNLTSWVLHESEAVNQVVLGDFNIVANNNLDIISGEKHSEKIVKSFNIFMSNLSLVDVWREKYGQKKEFSWSRERPYSARRLDYILTSETLFYQHFLHSHRT